MEQQISWHFFETVRNRLNKKGYTEVRPPDPYEFAMLKQTFGGTLPKVITIIDTTMTTDSPTSIYNRHHYWFKTLLGRTGAGVLLFIYFQPTAQVLDEVIQLGKGILGYGQVVAGVYDPSSNKYWMSDHMGWPAEIFN